MVIADYKCKSYIPKKTYSYYSDSNFKFYHDSFPLKLQTTSFQLKSYFQFQWEVCPLVGYLTDQAKI